MARAFGAGPGNASAMRATQSLVDLGLREGVKGGTSPAVAAGIRDVASRSLASVTGAPVDVAVMAMAPFGYKEPAPLLGSEWIGQRLVDMGAVSTPSRLAAELLAKMATPAAIPKAAATGLAFMAAMSPEGRARLLADLMAGKGSGSYRLGDVTEGQAKALQRLGLPKTETRDVMMTHGVFDHLQSGRIARDNYTPADVVKFAEQAMSNSSQADLNSAKAYQNLALVNRKHLRCRDGAPL